MDTTLTTSIPYKMQIKLGSIIEKLIAVITLGYGYKFSMWVARKLGYQDCGCKNRRDYLDTLFNKKDIKL